MTMKTKKSKTSKVKRNNITKTKLYKQGKIKSKKKKNTIANHGSIQKISHANPPPVTEEIDSEDLLQMIDTKDLEYLKRAVSDPSYSLYQKDSQKDKGKKRKKSVNEIDNIEEEYEKEKQSESLQPKRTRHLLPIKTAQGLVRRTINVELPDDVDGDDAAEQEVKTEEEETGSLLSLEEGEEDMSQPLSTVEVLARRQQLLAQYKLRIGLLASTLLEDPQNKVKNIAQLLDLMRHCRAEVRLSVQKLVTVSLTEVFKDILPSYQIKHQDDSSVKLKKDTKSLQEFEKSLLKGYRLFLTMSERLAKRLIQRRGDARVRTEQVLHLGELALSSVCSLLESHFYFNYSRNIVQMLTPYLDHPRPSVRGRVLLCLSSVFKQDKRGEITLHIVRRINQLVKGRALTAHREVLDVLLALRIKDVNLDQEKQAEIKQKKFMTHKQKLLAMSKRERKRAKRLEEVEKELLETKAEESKESKQKNLTEVMKVVFTIYFRILKKAPSSNVLSSALEGLAKFAHCINVEFFSDLVGVLDGLMEEGEGRLRPRERLHCVQTVFCILSGQGEVLNIDPARFYTHLYNNLFYIHAGKTHEDVRIVLRILETVLVLRRKKVTTARLLALSKRLGALACQLQHHGAVPALAILRRVMQIGLGADVLLDTDCSQGQGVYSAELPEPEHCNAASTALWELSALQRHYHPAVRTLARHVCLNDPSAKLPTELAKLNPDQLWEHFDPSSVVFRPAVPPPVKGVSGVVKPRDSAFTQRLTASVLGPTDPSAFSQLHAEVLQSFKHRTAPSLSRPSV